MPPISPRLALSLLLGLLLALGACERKDKQATPAPTKPAKVEARQHVFGDEVPGFVEWLSADGRTAVLYRFLKDTDGNGKIEARVGAHGEPEGDEPSVSLVDVPTNDIEEFDELVATESSRRYLVLRRNEELVLVDTIKKQREKLAQASSDPDTRNPCLPARQASFDPTGRFLSYLLDDGKTTEVRDLRAQTKRRHSSDAEVLWRSDPTPRGWAVLQEVREDSDANGTIEPPVQKTSCVCRWCKRFASSVGSYGWEGDQPRAVLVAPDGERREVEGRVIPITQTTLYSVRRKRLEDLDGEPVALPQGCRTTAVAIGEARILARCAQSIALFDPSSGEIMRPQDQELPRLEPLDTYAMPFASWLPMKARTGANQQRMARLSVEDARADIGPMVLQMGSPHFSGRMLGANSEQVFVYDVATGAVEEIDARANELDGLSFRTNEGWRVVDPNTGQHVAAPEKPDFVASNGCFLLRKSKTSIATGPWTVSCP